MRTALSLAVLVSLGAFGCRDDAKTVSATETSSESEAAPVEAPRVWSFATFGGEDTARSARVVVVSTGRLRGEELAVEGRDGQLRTLRLAGGEITGAHRFVYRAELDELTPQTAYRYEVRAPGVTHARTFRTLPASGMVRAAFGGDLHSTKSTERLLRVVAKEGADVLVLGGDLAYANGKPDNVALWDRLLGLLQDALTREDGVAVPVVAAIGNHEVDWTLQNNPSPQLAPFYYALFAERRPRGGSGETFYARALADHTVLLVLDSRHMFEHALQAPFIEKTLARHASKALRLATYHVPLYPSFRPFDTKRSELGRKHWGPVFDEGALTIAFENHDHTLKRTPPLKAGKPDPTGTLYLGDGCMGHSERPPDPTRPYLAKTSADFHVWIADLDETGATVRALSPEGKELDRVRVDSASAPKATAKPPPPAPPPAAQ